MIEITADPVNVGSENHTKGKISSVTDEFWPCRRFYPVERQKRAS
jgi:hypothetical protein